MPTVVLVDTSLSMSRLVRRNPSTPTSPVEGSDMEILQVAVQGVQVLLDQLEVHCRLEHLALLQYSSLCQLVAPFTREMDLVRAKLSSLACQDRSSLEVGLQGVVSMVLEEWGTCTPVTLIIVTDGSLGYGTYSLDNLASAGPTEMRLPLPFPCSMSVICLADKSLNSDLKRTRVAYESLFSRLGVESDQSSFHMVEGSLSRKSAEALFREVAALHCTKWCGRLELGPDMATQVQLCPPPKNFSRQKDFTVVRRELSDCLLVRGFLALSDISSPPVYSRHLILPAGSLKDKSPEEESKTPNLCVFLHGALKVENMCALVEIGTDWFGVVYSWSDNKKKSSLMLSLFEPGLDPVPWLGPLNRLGPAKDLNETTTSPFPVKSDRKPSYSSSPVVWIKQSGIQSDIQKVLRHARKLPDKTVQFYKELNRLKRAAVCLGFYELLEGVAQICERECTLLPTGVSPDCAIQLTYVAQVLRSPECYHVNHQVIPKLTHFNQGKF